MDKKFMAGLANQTFDEFDNIKTLRNTFIESGADAEHITKLECVMSTLYTMYLDITRSIPVKE